MNKNICHGGERIIRTPRFGTGNAYNDFGLGFYCCEQPLYAAECACSPGRNGFVSSYSINTDGLRIINLCSSQYNVLHWLDLLLNFRVFPDTSSLVHQAKEYLNRYYAVDFQGSDCIIGYRADGAGFALASDFMSGRLSYQGLARALVRKPAMKQFVLKSNRAFDRISFTGYEPALSCEHYPARAARELKVLKEARGSGRQYPEEIRDSGRQYSDKSRGLGSESRGSGKAMLNELFIDQLIKEDIRPYDLRLRK